MPRRRYRRVSNEDRDRLIDRYEEGEDFTDVAFNLDIPRKTAYGIIRRFVETGDRYATVGRGRMPSLLDLEARDFLVMMVEATPTITISELNDLG